MSIYWVRLSAGKHLDKAIERLNSGAEIPHDDPLQRAIAFHARREELNAVAELEALKADSEQLKNELNTRQKELDDEALRLETLQAELREEKRLQQFINLCCQSLTRDYVALVNEGDHEKATETAAHLEALLRDPFTATEIGSYNLLTLIDEVLIRLAPIANDQQSRILVVPSDASLSTVETNGPRFQDILFQLLLQHLARGDRGIISIEYAIGDNLATLNFRTMDDTGFYPITTMALDEALTENEASWFENKLTFPVRPHPGAFANPTGLRALVVADTEIERRSVSARLTQLGIVCTTEFDSGAVDLCVVCDENSETFRALRSYLSDRTYVLLLGNKHIYHNPMWLQVSDPVTQVALEHLIQDIAVVKDESEQKHILAVDDSQANIQLLEMQLAELGHKVTIARSGAEALAQVEKNEFDLVFMDIQMPDLNGAEATRQIRLFNKKLPIIGLTAHATLQEREEYSSAGIDDVVIKPVRMESLKSIIHRMGRNLPRPPLPASTGLKSPIFDLSLSLANANQRFELAAELLDLLIAGLPEDQKAINEAATDYPTLKRAVHKLHGAVRYCGVPRLTRAIEKLETALKQEDLPQVPLLLNLLNGEITALIAWRRDNPDVLESP